MRIASFDIGIHNFAYYVEEISEAALCTLRSIPRNEVETDVNQLFAVGTYVTSELLDLAPGKKFRGLTTPIRRVLNQALGKRNELWDTCDVFIIEQQYNGRGGTNMAAIRLSENAIAYFIDHCPTKTVEFVPSKLKTIFMKRGLPKRERKWRAVEIAHGIFTLRQCAHGLEALSQDGQSKQNKRDDVADCVLQCQAWKFNHCLGRRRLLGRSCGTRAARQPIAEMPSLPRQSGRRKGTCVAQLKDGVVLHRYPTMKVAAQAMGVAPSSISAAVCGRTQSCRGFVWKRV